MASTDQRFAFPLACAIVAVCVSSIWLLDEPLWDNETQRMAVVKHFLDPSWIPDDWFLNTPMIYQIPFNLVAAPFVSFLDLGTGTILLRFLLYLWFASGIVALARKMRIGLVALIPAVMTAVVIRCIGSLEWMVGHAEAKAVAYGAILWAFSFLIGRNYRAAAALLGLAMTFHVLVGLYAALTSLLFLLANRRFRSEFIDTLPITTPVFLITGGFGIFTIAHNLISRGGSDALTNLIYISRNSIHVWPPVWSTQAGLYFPAWVAWIPWTVKALVSVSVLLFVARRSESQYFREFAQIALCSTPFFVIGILLYSIGPTGFLKYLPFRFPDVMIPLAALLLFFGEWEKMAAGINSYRLSSSKKHILSVGLHIAAGLAVIGGFYKFSSDWEIKRCAGVPWAFVRLSPEERDVTLWIRDNTEPDALFLSDPTFAPFYVTAERGILVAWKHFPQNENDVREWRDRLVAVNRGREILLCPPQIACEEIKFSFNTLPLDVARSLADLYNLNYYFGPVREDWMIAPKYRSGRKAVYDLR